MSAPPRNKKRKRPRGLLHGWAFILELTTHEYREVRAQIWRRSLAEHGGVIIAAPDDAPAKCGHIVVIADTEEGAERWGGACERKVEVVHPGWAGDSLGELISATRRPKPTEDYPFERKMKEAVVEKAESEGNQERGVLRSSWRSGIVLPRVWACEAPLGAREKQSMGAAVPTWLVEHPHCNPNMTGFNVRNASLLQQLRRVSDKRELLNRNPLDKRFLTYARAAAFASALPFEITSADDVQGVHCVADRIRETVQGYLVSGRVVELDEFENADGELATVERLSKVHGISIARARKLFHAGVRSVEDAVEYFRTNEQRWAVETLKSLPASVTISRADAVRLVAEISAFASREMPDVHLEFKLGGGFRRGNEVGHDADILFCHRHRGIESSVMGELVTGLLKSGLIVEVLRGQIDKPGSGEIRYAHHQEPGGSGHIDYPFAHDVQITTCNVRSPMDGRVRQVRVDFVGVRRREEWPFATLCWSGSTLFLRELFRRTDELHGWKINAHGIFGRESRRRVPFEIECRTEHDVFAVLGLSYLPPFERCC
eukprot:Plantae.Rhodophyta-Palmaria_palmata.ctg2574.p1 GENE.Plantae.Rhodophyta-Palmaria_palmata.ctg2574~~Plantae.Rhodophyta-Palmaria_palmata.ctg2574.p1  ORF type:complete len:545 (-),score=86.42 Plantae.Rhodophyta-Palmaria_palmata.ctg2574:441-2075(-)